jgi:hypothetical protein
MDYDNGRDRKQYGYDAGSLVDGTVTQDPDTREWVLVDEDGKAFSSQAVLAELAGKKVRITVVSFEAIETIEKMLAATQGGSVA